jgi:ribonuclease D
MSEASTVQTRVGPTLRAGDIGDATAAALRASGRVAWDIETSGLDWDSDRIGTCQLYSPETGPIVVQLNGAVPRRLCDLLRDGSVVKVFHHAPFDVRFMRAQWGVQASRVKCTKIASKLLFPKLQNEAHSLDSLLRRITSVEISKVARTSNWLAEKLSEEQLEYASADVQYLLPLIDALEEAARARGLADLLAGCYAHIPVRAELDVRGYRDIYVY